MAQDRLFHKRLGHGDRVGQLSDFEYIVWQAYVLSADDYGVMRLSAHTLQADHDRLSQKNGGAIERALRRGVAVGLLTTFQHQGRTYVCQLDWQDFQKVRYPAKSHNPVPPAEILEQMSPLTLALFHERTSSLSPSREKVPERARAGRGRETELSHGDANAHGDGNGNGDPDGRATAVGLMDLWNTVTQSPLPKLRELTDERKRKLKARLAKRPLVAEWAAIFSRVQASGFLRGLTSDRGWVADFDWVVKNETVVARILEGKYDDRAGPLSVTGQANQRVMETLTAKYQGEE